MMNFKTSRWAFDRKMLLILGGFFVLAYLLPLACRPVFRPDETRYGVIAREMLATGDWVVPRINGVRYFEKPALGHQLNALAFKTFGINRFALRIVPALAVLVTMLLLYFLVRSATPDRLLPALAAGFYLANGYVFGIGTFAVLDSQLAAAITGACGCAYGMVQASGKGRFCLFSILTGVCAGIAFLFKGLVGIAVPAMACGVWLLWRRDWKKILLYGWIPLAAAVAVVLPWSLAIARAEPDFWNYFLIEEHWHRFTSETYDRSGEPVWYFLPILIGGGFPAWFWWIPAAGGFTRKCWKNDLFRFLFCWAVIPFCFFSASSCKTGTYVLPCFPAFAGLLAIGVRGAMRRNRKFLNGFQTVFAGIVGSFFVLLAFGWLAAPAILSRLCPGETIPAERMILAGAVTLLAGIAMLKLRKSNVGKHWLGMLAALGTVIAAALLAMPEWTFGNKCPEKAIRVCLAKEPLQPGDVLITDRVSMSSVLWTLGESGGRVRIIEDPGELSYAFRKYPEEYGSIWIPIGDAEARNRAGKTGKRVWITFWKKNDDGRYSPGVEPLLLIEDHDVKLLRF